MTLLSTKRKRRLLSVSTAALFLCQSPPGSVAFTPSSSSSEPFHMPLIKVPTYRLYRGTQYIDQLLGRVDTPSFHRLLSSNVKKSSTKPLSPPTTDLLELESLDQLNEVLGQQPQDRLCMVEFYGAWCVACKEMLPMYSSLPFTYRNVLFCRGEINKFPQLKAATTTGMTTSPPIQDRSINVSERVDGCPRCQGTGFIECSECQGKGHLLREVPGKEGMVVADFCPSCTGKKKVPCPLCGGKCYMCD